MKKLIEALKSFNFKENFEILNYINSGSSGIVYEGFYPKNLKKHVCLKFLLNN